jgi:hypothetical protein
VSGRLRRARLLATLLVAASLLVPSSGAAIRYRRPFNAGIGVNYGRDDGGGAGCIDFQCGGVCYDGHGGTDFPLPLGTTVVAAADGTVTATNDGCGNYGGLGSSCGGGCGNYVRVDHVDGQRTLYCHMQLGTIAVSTGQQVSCGDVLGRSASSGNSSGPHLHFAHYIWGSTHDPFAGGCSQATSYWMDQGSYPHNMPSTACEPTCQCNPGDVQPGGCGNCGTNERTCGSDCHWGAWSTCVGQGECGAGSVDSRPCCDCGTETRLCSPQCAWEPWGRCAGPDPNGGIEACTTDLPGLCVEGRVRCVDGCVGCASEWEPQAETCDGRDEDCSGTIDDGFPQTMSEPPPALAARLVDSSYAQVLGPGEAGQAWALFLNVGQQSWGRGKLWLAAAATWDGASSQLYDPETWAAFDVAAVLAEDVAPGEVATFVWQIRAAADATGTIEESFQLVSSSGEIVRCPSPDVPMRVLVRARGPQSQSQGPGGAAGSAGDGVDEESGCGCRVAASPARSSVPTWAALGVLGALGLCRARRRASVRRG